MGRKEWRVEEALRRLAGYIDFSRQFGGRGFWRMTNAASDLTVWGGSSGEPTSTTTMTRATVMSSDAMRCAATRTASATIVNWEDLVDEATTPCMHHLSRHRDAVASNPDSALVTRGSWPTIPNLYERKRLLCPGGRASLLFFRPGVDEVAQGPSETRGGSGVREKSNFAERECDDPDDPDSRLHQGVKG